MDISSVSGRAWYHAPVKLSSDAKDVTGSKVGELPDEHASEVEAGDAEGEILKPHANGVASNPALFGIAGGYLGNVANMTVEEATKEIEHVSRLIESSTIGSSVVHAAYGDQQTWSLRVYLFWLQQHAHGLEYGTYTSSWAM
ncbi:hypothetical protein SAZ10_00350 [Mesorhizobium sp. BAC0120]|uniref:hypothetical protein n=1 Tax=Mesorhizobium sp. BAC0120 TaxID=3090670 RepID=UPI00298C3A7A|nr:hypothetical protein [Mesorhizobium sp. BAC0120]MDW6020206.1 hypothetical protein [Mesorhizobium sp. BAC0120]